MANERQFKSKARIVATRKEDEYQASIPIWVMKDDVVLEVGCRTGKTTAVIAQYCKEVVGIDVSPDSIIQARTKHPNLQFEAFDGFNLLSIQGLGKSFSKIYVDMSGIFGYVSVLDAISLLSMYATVLNPRAIVIKSQVLKSLAQRCFAWDPAQIPSEEELLRPGTKFVGARGVKEYRATVPVWVNSEDIVLEIGCEWGTTTMLIAQHGKEVIGTDISLDCITRARDMHPDIHFEVLDGFDVQAALSLGRRFTKIYIDISGLSGYHSLLDVICLLNTYAVQLRPEAIIIKSGALKHFAQKCVAWSAHDPKLVNGLPVGGWGSC